ncbi:iron/ascorbate oxidoreductase-like protein 2 [Seiridium cupressi]
MLGFYSRATSMTIVSYFILHTPPHASSPTHRGILWVLESPPPEHPPQMHTIRLAVSVAYNPDIHREGVGKDAIPELLRRENSWPERGACPKFQSCIEPYQLACLGSMGKLIRIMALAMGLREDFFDKKTKYPIASVVSLDHPPQSREGANEAGLGAQTDIQKNKCSSQTCRTRVLIIPEHGTDTDTRSDDFNCSAAIRSPQAMSNMKACFAIVRVLRTARLVATLSR